MTALPKPAKGSALLARRAKKQQTDAHERAEKAAARKRDGYRCRWPSCTYRALKLPIEVAHLTHKGMGGDPRQLRTTRDQLITLCQPHHQGGHSLHSGDLEIQPLTEAGTDGPCAFYEYSPSGRSTQCVTFERAPGVLAS